MLDSDAVASETADALLATIRQVSGHDDLAYAEVPVPLRGGYYAEMVRFSLADPPAGLAGRLVGRIVPNPVTAAWEAALQREVAAQGFPTPAVRLVADEHTPLGRSLLVMDLVDGSPILGDLDPSKVVSQVPNLLRQLPDRLAGLAASLHALDRRAVTRELEALDGGIPTTTAGFVQQQAALAEAHGRPDLAAAGERLLATEPASPHRAITHGDLHPLNVLITDRGPVLIDWTVARVAHPAFTLAFTDLMLANPPVELPRSGSLALRPVAAAMVHRFHRTYRRLAQPADLVSPRELAWHRQVHAYRILVELAGWDAAGTRPVHHPWLVLEPVTQRLLDLR